MSKRTNKEQTMKTKADIKRWAIENQTDGYLSTYHTVNNAIDWHATYTPGNGNHGKPAVIPTKARAAEDVAAYWAATPNTSADFAFARQCVVIARALAAYYTNNNQ